MSLLALAEVGLQAATLVGVLALLLDRQGQRSARRVPDHVDVDATAARVDLGRRGALTVDGVIDGRVPAGVRLDGALDGLVVYEVWALSRAGWVQLVEGEGGWASPLLGDAPIRRLRLWIDRSVAAPDTRPARRAAPMLIQAALVLGRSSGLPSLPPLGPEALAAVRWAAEREQDVLVAGLLDGWTEACLAASRVGWVLGVPAGDGLLGAWARGVTRVEGAPATAFARWFTAELGQATRRGLDDRAIADRRDPVARLVFAAAARLVRSLDDGLALDACPPAAVGPRHRERWLVDEVVAARLDNPPVHGLVQPVAVLRPMLRRGELVLLEGEVA